MSTENGPNRVRYRRTKVGHAVLDTIATTSERSVNRWREQKAFRIDDFVDRRVFKRRLFARRDAFIVATTDFVRAPVSETPKVVRGVRE